MLTTDFPFLHPRHIDHQLAGTLASLATDLDRIRDNKGPTTTELRSAPLITDWRSTVTPLGLRLIGRVHHHPRLGDRLLMTSPIWAADPGGKWVRTLSRFYRLGRPLRHAAQADDPDACDFEGGL